MGLQCECAHHGCRSHHCGTETARGDGGTEEWFFLCTRSRDGELLSAKPIAKVTWATSVDLETGRPVEIAAALERKPGERVPALPTGLGAHNWHAQSYSPLTGLVYIPAVDAPPGYDIGSEEGSHLIGNFLLGTP